MQYTILQRRTEERVAEFLNTNHRTPNEKMITTIQICFQCKSTFPLKRGRRRCPRCEGTLRSITVVAKATSPF
jgi:rRNA maturation endonuclease Nob1